METIHYQTTIEKDGEIKMENLPCKKGQQVEMIVLIKSNEQSSSKNSMTAKQVLKSPLVGMWKDRKDIVDGKTYARKLREQAQNRKP